MKEENKFFYSNCFFEAIKAKFKDWKDVEIFIIPRKYFAFKEHPCVRSHWYFTKKSEPNITYEFNGDGGTHKHYFFSLFRYGSIKKISVEKREKFFNEVVKYEAKKIAKKYRINILQNSYNPKDNITNMYDRVSLDKIHNRLKENNNYEIHE